MYTVEKFSELECSTSGEASNVNGVIYAACRHLRSVSVPLCMVIQDNK